MVPLTSTYVSKGKTTYGSGSLDTNPMIPRDQIEPQRRVNSDTMEQSFDSENGLHENANFEIDSYCCTWKEYFFSLRFLELMACILPFVAIWHYYETYLITPHMRPIHLGHVYTKEGGAIGSEILNNRFVFNPVNAEKYTGDTIGHREYQILMGICPLLLQLAVVWFRPPRFVSKFESWDVIHRTICTYFVGIGTTDAVCNSVKYYVGYLRPMFLDVCQPYYDEIDSTFHCTNEDSSTIDARVGFPSNHSAWSFCGMLILSMYLSKRFGIGSIQKNGANFYEKALSSSHTTQKKLLVQKCDREVYYRFVSFLCYSPMLLAVYVAASRVFDNRHFPADVITGTVLGGSVATMVFGIWFP